jgi:hypothetical protein
MRYAYQNFLRLYPAPYRTRFGQEMADVFEEAAGDHRARGILAYWEFLIHEFAGVLAGAFAQWTGEYADLARRRMSAPFLLSIAAGTAITAFFQGSFYNGIGGLGRIPAAPRTPDVAQPQPDFLIPVVLACACLLFISVFSVAFVWNMRIIGNRAGRMKPIWMPGREEHARIAKRHQTLHGNSGRQRCEFHRTGR